ncbi:thiamine pyrophosphate-dependent enzyme [Actinomadura luteofluorescens]|uniref:thiamine pyrophosphate-dependent enzyme n=1 Tax=Actinomadura luteofluorescens TaxID=46163 RepID=UPI003624E3FF
MRSWDPGRYAFTHEFGAIGQALGVAIGAAFARPGERVTAVLGDGCLMMSLSELSTAVRYRLPLTLFVMNDGGYGQERHSLTARACRTRRHGTHGRTSARWPGGSAYPRTASGPYGTSTCSSGRCPKPPDRCCSTSTSTRNRRIPPSPISPPG